MFWPQKKGPFPAEAGAKAPWPPPLDPPLLEYETFSKVEDFEARPRRLDSVRVNNNVPAYFDPAICKF